MKKELSKEIKSLLKFKELSCFSYERLGREIGVSNMTVYRWCKGYQRPSLMARGLIKKFLKKYYRG